MNSRVLLWSGVGAAGLVGALGGAWIASLPPETTNRAVPRLGEEDAAALLAALKPPKRQRPVIAIIGINDATETTDYLMPYGILQRANVADVRLLATQPGPVELYPALKVEPQATVAEFDAQYPDGADYVIVPAMSRDDDPAALAWLKRQAGKGAMIVGVCAGAKVVGEAGLLDGKRATTHWYFVKELRGKHPSMRYVADRRIVVDQGVATTTGITASMPLALTLIEAIAGRDKAEAVGRDIGVTRWNARHDSHAFQLTRPFALTAIGNTVALWNREQLGLEIEPGVDEVSLAIIARVVADLSVSCGDVLAFERTEREPQRHPHPPRSGVRKLACRASASGNRGSPTGKRVDRSARPDLHPLWAAHGRLRRHAARISEAGRVAIAGGGGCGR
jgi:putative intracellular protease/amidase